MLSINAARLEELGACEKQVALFRGYFGEGDAPLTLETALGVAHVFDWDWAAENLLSEDGYEAYMKAKKTLWDAYEEARKPLLGAYKEAEKPLRDTYEEARKPLLDAYERGLATLFINLYCKQ